MLVYMLEARSEPFHWRDVEAIPLYLVGGVIMAVLYRVSEELPSASQGMMIKAVLILLLLGLRCLALGDPSRVAEAAPVPADSTAPAPAEARA